MILAGKIFVTGVLDNVYKVPLETRIINMDEDGNLSNNGANILAGTCLLPPVEAKIAEADGNERAYDEFYTIHLLEPNQQQYLSALVSFLYKGGELLIYLPDDGFENTKEKFIFNINKLFGIHIGNVEGKTEEEKCCYYDESCLPIWLNMVYSAKVISAREYLTVYPVDAELNNQPVLNQLIEEICPYGRSYQDQIDSIKRLHKVLHVAPDVMVPLRRI